MAKITIEELSGSLKEYLNGLGLTEVQVQELIDKFEDEKIGDISQLSTSEKGSIVGAINELFQDVDNGKKLIADVIDDPSIDENSTFNAMSEVIKNKLIDINNDYISYVSYTQAIYPYIIDINFTAITNSDYKKIGDIIYYFIEGFEGTSSSFRQAYLYSYNMKTKSIIKRIQVDANTTAISLSCFLEEGIIIFSNTSVTMYNYDDFSKIKSGVSNITMKNSGRLLKFGDYIYGLAGYAGTLFKFDINNFKTVKVVTLNNSSTEAVLLNIENNYVYAATVYGGTSAGTIQKLDMDLNNITSSHLTIPGGLSFVIGDYVYTGYGIFNGTNNPCLNLFRISMASNDNAFEQLGLIKLDLMFNIPTTNGSVRWCYFTVDDYVFITFNGAIARFNKNDSISLTSDMIDYLCINSSGANVVDIKQIEDYYMISTMGWTSACIHKAKFSND